MIAVMWQDLIFTAGSVFSIIVLVPTLTDRMSSIPLGTSVSSAVIGIVYGCTFYTMDMTFSAAGALATGLLWSVIALLRSPRATPDESEQAGTSDVDQQGVSPLGD